MRAAAAGQRRSPTERQRIDQRLSVEVDVSGSMTTDVDSPMLSSRVIGPQLVSNAARLPVFIPCQETSEHLLDCVSHSARTTSRECRYNVEFPVQNSNSCRMPMTREFRIYNKKAQKQQ